MSDALLLFPEDEQWGDFPDDFIDDNAEDDVIDTLKLIRQAVGAPLRPLVTDIDLITSRGHAATIRGIRFASGADALIWLFRRGIFLFSNVVQMGDGTWGVSIRDSDPVPTDSGDAEDDIVF